MANLFTNPDFEVDTSGWESNGAFGSFLPSTWVRDTAKAHSGAASLRVTWPNPDGSLRSWINHTPVTGLTVGRMYRFTIWAYVPTGAPDLRQEAAFYGSYGTPFTTKDAWGQLTWDMVASGTSHHFGVATNNAFFTNGTQIWLDDAYVDELIDTSQQPQQGTLPEVTMQHLINRGTFDPALATAAVTGFGAGRLVHLREIKTGAGWQQLIRQQWPMP